MFQVCRVLPYHIHIEFEQCLARMDIGQLALGLLAPHLAEDRKEHLAGPES
jgi:hypothetical protein